MKLLVAQICACAVLAAFAASTVAHEGATGVVKARMDSMEEMGRAVKRIKARLDKGGDLAGVVRDAKAIQSAAQKMPSLFPVGSHDGHSDAKPNVWQHWPAFVKAATRLSAKLRS